MPFCKWISAHVSLCHLSQLPPAQQKLHLCKKWLHTNVLNFVPSQFGFTSFQVWSHQLMTSIAIVMSIPSFIITLSINKYFSIVPVARSKTHKRLERMLFIMTKHRKLCFVTMKTFYVFWSCFRTLAVILVSDFLYLLVLVKRLFATISQKRKTYKNRNIWKMAGVSRFFF